MSKNVITIIIVVVLLGGGLLYSVVFKSDSGCKKITRTVEHNLVSQANKWNFIPEIIEVNKCERVILNVYNEDVYDHGIGIDLFGINKRMPPKATTTVEFTANVLGEIPFVCSVACGSGIVDSVKRGHYEMLGKIIVK